jgi:hypothetical protein
LGNQPGECGGSPIVNFGDEPHTVCLLSKSQLKFSSIGDRLLDVVRTVSKSNPGVLGDTRKEQGNPDSAD